MISRWATFTALFLFLSLSAFATGPGSESSSRKQSGKKLRKAIGIKQVKQLKEGALLIRLHFNQKSIESIRKSGKEEKAIKYQNKIREKNLKIVSAFNNQFKFCPVLFFAADQSQLFFDGKFENITFLDSALNPAYNIEFPDSNYFIGEFHYTERDTAKYFSYYSSVHNESFKNERVENYYGSMERGLEALIIRNSNFHQLSKPFPYNVKVYRKFRLHIPRSPERVVIIMNRKLHRFFKRKYPNYTTVSVGQN